jgi:hypothetical protein
VVPRGQAVWWDPATGKILHEECSERTFDDRLTELGREKRRETLRVALSKPDLEVPKKYSPSVEDSKERIQERRKRMGGWQKRIKKNDL